MKRIDELQAEFCDAVSRAVIDLELAYITEHEFVAKIIRLREQLILDCNERLSELFTGIHKAEEILK